MLMTYLFYNLSFVLFDSLHPFCPPPSPQHPVSYSLYLRIFFGERNVCLCSTYVYMRFTAVAAKSLQSCPTLCDPIEGSPPGSLIPGILQARTLEWVTISFSNAWKWKWSRSVVSDPQRLHGLQPTRLPRPWDFPGKSTGVGCHCICLSLSNLSWQNIFSIHLCYHKS